MLAHKMLTTLAPFFHFEFHQNMAASNIHFEYQISTDLLRIRRIYSYKKNFGGKGIIIFPIEFVLELCNLKVEKYFFNFQ